MQKSVESVWMSSKLFINPEDFNFIDKDFQSLPCSMTVCNSVCTSKPVCSSHVGTSKPVFTSHDCSCKSVCTSNVR